MSNAPSVRCGTLERIGTHRTLWDHAGADFPKRCSGVMMGTRSQSVVYARMETPKTNDPFTDFQPANSTDQSSTADLDSSTDFDAPERGLQSPDTDVQSSEDDFQSDPTMSDDAGPIGSVIAAEEVSITTPPWTQQSGPSRRCNVGRTEQKFRIGGGVALLAAAAFAPIGRGWKIGLAVLGAAEVITGTTRYCPVSQMLGINTCRADEL